MQTAVATLPPPAAPAAAVAGKATDSIATAESGTAGTFDFAALLFSQIHGQLAAQELPAMSTLASQLAGATAALPALADAEPTGEGLTDEDGIVGDPALILAALGLSLDPAAQRPADPAELSPALAARHAMRGTTDGATGGLLPALSSGPGANATAAAANFAGFDATLAETLAADDSAPVLQPATAAPAGMPQTRQAHAAHEPMQMQTPLREPAWQSEFGQKIVWMATQERQSAQLTLNPPQMGPIEISLNVKNDQATASFVSANPEVREAIESALPRLREMLAGVGVELGQTNVGAESFRQDRHEEGRSDRAAGNDGGDGSGTTVSVSEVPSDTRIASGNGLVDTFV